MNQSKIFRDFAALPGEAQKVVIDLITLLSKHSAQPKPLHKKKSARLANEKFIGMWADRADRQDSSAYVRSLREHEWK